MTTHPPIYRYSHLPHEDVMLALWWGSMQAAGDLELTFGKQSQSLSLFYGLFASRDHGLFYAQQEDGSLGAAMVLVPTMTGCAFATLYVAPPWRLKQVGREVTEALYTMALKEFPVLLGFTRQERLLAIHQRWGYDVLGRLPGVFDGHDGWVVVLTDERFQAARDAGWPKDAAESTEHAPSLDS